MEESERKRRYTLIVKLLESEVCPTHNLTVYVEGISHNLVTDYKACCPEFRDYIYEKLEGVNPKIIH